MSQKQEIYSAYLNDWNKNHPNIVKPEFFGGIGGTPIETLDTKGAVRLLHYSTKAVKPYCFPDGIYQLTDGRVVEFGYTTSGNFRLAYVFPNKEAWDNYAEPMSYNVYFEHW